MSTEPGTAPDERITTLRKGLEQDIKALGDRYTDDRLPLDMLPEWVRTLRGHGYPVDSADQVYSALASEELARVFPSLEGCLMISQACASFITEAGPPELR